VLNRSRRGGARRCGSNLRRIELNDLARVEDLGWHGPDEIRRGRCVRGMLGWVLGDELALDELG
jgi:hypothetical protein